MFGILLLLFTVVPAIELYLLIKVGQVIGAFDTITIIILTGIIGAAFARSQGRMILLKIQQKLSKGEVPADTGLHGLLVFVGGILLITPGFITDIFGLCMVIPITRFLFIKLLKAYFKNGIQSGRFHVVTNMGGQGWQSTTQTSWEDSPRTREVTEVNVIDIKSEKKED